MIDSKNNGAVKLRNTAKTNSKRVIGKPFTSGYDARRNTQGRPSLGYAFAGYIRDIGDEVVDRKSKQTRLEKVIRRLYDDAATGKTQAAALLFERGWGRLRPDSELDEWTFIDDCIAAKRQIEESGTDWQSDPYLSQLMSEMDEQIAAKLKKLKTR